MCIVFEDSSEVMPLGKSPETELVMALNSFHELEADKTAEVRLLFSPLGPSPVADIALEVVG